MPQPGLDCVTLLAVGFVSSGCVDDKEDAGAVVAVDAVQKSADDGPAKLPESDQSGRTGAIVSSGNEIRALPRALEAAKEDKCAQGESSN